MSSSFGEAVRITVFGQSHSEAIGVVMDGLPVGEVIDMERVMAFMKRRAPGQHAYATPRKEADEPQILSGLFEGKTCGVPLCAVIANTNTRSKDYAQLKDIPRPGHADFTAEIKYKGFQDYRGGGHFSGRLTAPICFAGAVCLQILERKGIHVGAHILSIHDVAEEQFDPVNVTAEAFAAVVANGFPVQNPAIGEEMQACIQKARAVGDSVGGVIEAAVVGLPVGLGEPMFDGLESRLAAAAFAIPAVKGVEFGAGFAAAQMLGSQNNDSFVLTDQGVVRTKTNHHGGSLGGISSGMPITMRVAFKPTPSIGQAQDSISIKEQKNVELSVVGRHDPCIVPRAVPVVEAVLALTILDFACRA